ncbi:MAG TPA: hypothetical protein VFN67_18865 [Polyangiales bacterium]|nr:hypothetical protein [Polyangiales bacterium]
MDRSLIESFKELLRLHGYKTDDCQENTDAWLKLAERVGPQGIDKYREIDQRLVAAQKCTVPPSALRSYSVKLILDHDKLLKNRRAVLHLVPLGNYPSIDGGYAHKPGELVGWYDIMNRAIDRGLNGHDDETSIRMSAPTEAVVGEGVEVDGRGSWDSDGDAFELRWQVTVDACVRGDERVPVAGADGSSCPEGMTRQDAVVYDQAARTDLIREFKVPMVGDYKIAAHAKIGAREEPERVLLLRAYPARSWAFYARVAFFPLPQYLLSDSRDRQLGYLSGIGLQRRFLHRLGTLGWYEEIHIGVGFDALNQRSTYNYEGHAQALLMGVHLIGRTLDRTGRYGLASQSSFGAASFTAFRGAEDSEEWGWFADALIGFYYAFTDNYIDRKSKFCATVCPSVTVGPTMHMLNNVQAKIRGISLGFQLMTHLEF